MAGTGLSNADFRALLATPRPGAAGGGGGGEKQKKAKKPGKNFKPGGKLGEEDKAKDEGQDYRCGLLWRLVLGLAGIICWSHVLFSHAASLCQPRHCGDLHSALCLPGLSTQGPCGGAAEGAVSGL